MVVCSWICGGWVFWRVRRKSSETGGENEKPVRPVIERAGPHQTNGIMCDACTRHFRWLVHVGEVRQWDADGAARLCLGCLKEAVALGQKEAVASEKKSADQ